jgi:cbb3-type cytochrome c oxidase subunit III
MKVLTLMIACCWLSSAAAAQQGTENTAAIDAGKALYQSCIACHGAKAEGNPTLNAPALAGQLAGYLQRQLQHFKQGRRGAEDAIAQPMQSMAAALENEQAVEQVAQYLASLTPATADQAAVQGDPRRGNNLYQGNCGACHGGKGEGNSQLQAPNLAILDAAYIQRQMQHFQQGLRGAAPNDRWGKQMAMMANTLPDQQALLDVIAYLQQLRQH